MTVATLTACDAGNGTGLTGTWKVVKVTDPRLKSTRGMSIAELAKQPPSHYGKEYRFKSGGRMSYQTFHRNGTPKRVECSYIYNAPTVTLSRCSVDGDAPGSGTKEWKVDIRNQGKTLVITEEIPGRPKMTVEKGKIVLGTYNTNRVITLKRD